MCGSVTQLTDLLKVKQTWLTVMNEYLGSVVANELPTYQNPGTVT